tara:strand:+ start:5457 stop:5828 length:372 start_codon:yes stop_codon:yes gene_type:complete
MPSETEGNEDFEPRKCAPMMPYALAYCLKVKKAYQSGEPVVLGYERYPRRNEKARTGTLSVGIMNGDEYKPIHKVTGLFGGDCRQVLSDQLTYISGDVLRVLKLYVDGLEDPKLKKELLALDK